MKVEPPLQSLTGESLQFASANNEDGARADVGLWGCEYQKTFFDVKVFNANAPSHRGKQVSSL